MTEFSFIEWIQASLQKSDAHHIKLGIGDDAAVLDPPTNRNLVVSTDAAVEGVHFRRDVIELRSAAARAFIAAASDLAAMGAAPYAALTSLILPAGLHQDDRQAVVLGLRDASDEYNLPIVGGNLSSGAELSITTTVLGTVTGDGIKRSGAHEGDGLYVTGTLGAAALGLAFLLRGRTHEHETAQVIAKWRQPRARIREGLELANLATACIDVSDGLLADLAHLCKASAVGAQVHLDAIPRPANFTALCHALDLSTEATLLTSGEEYELLFTSNVPIDARLATRIGTMTTTGDLCVLDTSGNKIELPTKPGFTHF